MTQSRLYIDESGDHGYGRLDNPGGRFLAISGIVIECEMYRSGLKPELERLKQDVFPHDPDFPIVLHRREIIDQTGPFKVLQNADKRLVFDERFLQFISNQRYLLITVVLDKKEHLEKHGKAAFHPYHYCLTALLERYCGLLRFGNRTGDVLAESRGRKEDEALNKAYRDLLRDGTFFLRASFSSLCLPQGS